MATGEISLYTQRAAPRNVQVVSGAGGTIGPGDWPFVVTAWYGDGDETNILNAGSYEVHGHDSHEADAQTPVVAPTTITSKATITWEPPTRNGKPVSGVHHYTIHTQTGGGYYDWSRPGLRCGTVANADGVIPWYINSAVVTSITSVNTAVTPNITKCDADLDAFWIDGDYRGGLGAGTSITIAGTASNNGGKTVDYTFLVFTSRGPQTIVYITGAVTAEGAGGTMAFSAPGPTAFDAGTPVLHGLPSSARWGPNNIITLKYLDHFTGVPTRTGYRAYNDMLDDRDVEDVRIHDALDIGLTINSVSEMEWRYIMWYYKQRMDLYIAQGETLDASVAETEPTMGFGPVSVWAGRIGGLGPNLGIRGWGREGRSIQFDIESETIA